MQEIALAKAIGFCESSQKLTWEMLCKWEMSVFETNTRLNFILNLHLLGRNKENDFLF